MALYTSYLIYFYGCPSDMVSLCLLFGARLFSLQMEGDSKLTSKSGDGSVKKDTLGPHTGTSSSSAQGMGQQVAYNQGMGYMQPQYHNGDISN